MAVDRSPVTRNTVPGRPQTKDAGVNVPERSSERSENGADRWTMCRPLIVFFGGSSFFEAGLVLIFLSSLAIIFPNADLSDQVDGAQLSLEARSGRASHPM
jgi:hypothetical protein